MTAAAAAGAAADQRLAAASEIRAEADQQAASERHGIISELRAIRSRNNLAGLILASVEPPPQETRKERGGG